MKNTTYITGKLSIIIFSLFFFYEAFPQTFKEEVVTMDETTDTKDVLFVRAHEWFALTFRSANDVIQMADKNAGKLIGKGYVTVPMPNYGILSFTLIVECRDGRYKYTVQDVIHRYTDTRKVWGGDILSERSPAVPLNLLRSQWRKVRESSELAMNALILDLKNAMKKPVNDDW